MEGLQNTRSEGSDTDNQVQERQQMHHMVQWILGLVQSIQTKQPTKYSLAQFYKSRYIAQILHQISSDFFPLHLTKKQLQLAFIQFFYRQFGFYVHPLLGIQSQKQKMFLSLLLYACIYSQKKEFYVQKIMRLNPETQQKIVREIQVIQIQLKQMRNLDNMIGEMRKLEEQNYQLKSNLKNYSEQAQNYLERIAILQRQLQETKNQRNQFVLEKRKILSSFKLSSFAQYEDLCNRLCHQNELQAKKEERLIAAIQGLQNQNMLLNKQILASNSVIVELNSSYNSLHKNYQEITRQVSIYKESILQNESKMDGRLLEKNSKSLQSTEDDINMHSTIKQSKDFKRFTSMIGQDIFSNTGSSSASQRMSLGKNTRTSAYNMFKTTKDNLMLNQKNRQHTEEIQQLKLKIIQLEIQIGKTEKRQKYLLKKNRKFMNISDDFKKKYEVASNFTVTF